MTLQEKRSKAAKALRDMLDLAKSESRGLTAEEKTKHQNMVAEIDEIDDLMKRDKELAEVEQRDNELEQRVTATPQPPAPEDPQEIEAREFRDFAQGRMPEYEGRAYSSTSGSSGGYMVPTTLYKQLKEYLATDNIIRQLANVEQWDGDGSFPVVEAFGTTYLVAEGSEVDASTEATLGSRDVTGYQIMYRADVPKKLIANSTYPF